MIRIEDTTVQQKTSSPRKVVGYLTPDQPAEVKLVGIVETTAMTRRGEKSAFMVGTYSASRSDAYDQNMYVTDNEAEALYQALKQMLGH